MSRHLMCVFQEGEGPAEPRSGFKHRPNGSCCVARTVRVLRVPTKAIKELRKIVGKRHPEVKLFARNWMSKP